ncbi:MAG TPA: hypothetical protein VE645_19340 [Pseudonocardiaceae bacterium]|nr:hypothetical protein [Pseudonocardiaceae bacterium]
MARNCALSGHADGVQCTSVTPVIKQIVAALRSLYVCPAFWVSM